MYLITKQKLENLKDELEDLQAERDNIDDEISYLERKVFKLEVQLENELDQDDFQVISHELHTYNIDFEFLLFQLKDLKIEVKYKEAEYIKQIISETEWHPKKDTILKLLKTN